MTLSAASFVKTWQTNTVTKGMGSGANMKEKERIYCYTITGFVNKMLASIKINKKCFVDKC